jgi:hypothetical protein
MRDKASKKKKIFLRYTKMEHSPQNLHFQQCTVSENQNWTDFTTKKRKNVALHQCNANNCKEEEISLNPNSPET